MKALVKTDAVSRSDLQIMDVPKPVCGDDEVILKVKAVGICGSDLHFYTWDLMPPLPLIMGHEFCGEIAEIGKNVTGWKVGDRVISETYGACGECVYCKEGKPYLCENKKSPGIFAPGAYAEYIKSYPRCLHLIPEGVSEEEAACCEPAAIVMHAVKNRTGVNKGDTVLVTGVGMIGLFAVQIARALGAGTIIAAGVTSDMGTRLPLAKKFGADYIINSQTSNLEEEVLKITGGKKIDLGIECSGAEPCVKAILNLLKKDARFCAIGQQRAGVQYSIPWTECVSNCIKLIFCWGSEPQDWLDVIDFMGDKRLNFREAITHVITLEEWRDVFEHIGDPALVKGVIRPWGK